MQTPTPASKPAAEPVPAVLPMPASKPAAEPAPALVLPPPSDLAPAQYEAAPPTVQSPIEPPPPVAPMPNPEPAIPPAAPPVPDPEGVVRPEWPTIKGAPPRSPSPLGMDSSLPLTPTVELNPGTRTDETPASLDPRSITSPPGEVIGSSVHQTNASPATEVVPAAPTLDTPPMLPPPPLLPEKQPETPANGDSPLLSAIRAFQQNRPAEAVEHLKAYDPATQQILLSLMPAMVRLTEGKLQSMTPAEMDNLLEELTRVPNLLRPRASLQVQNMQLCREVHNFAHVEPFPDRHTFRSGDIVYLYLEMANFSCVRDEAGSYTITLSSSMELQDSSGKTVWKAAPRDVPDRVTTPPQDYYRNFRLCVPAVPAGTYRLFVKLIDRPTGREVRKEIELRIGGV